MIFRLTLTFLLICFLSDVNAQAPVPVKPRILISTDIGGTDPDDNQSMAHLLMYSDLFQLEGLVSSPSYGNGSREEILRVIGLYEKDYPKLKRHNKKLKTPASLRAITKQGNRTIAPLRGYTQSTEGSDWIISCARKKSSQPLWVLVWGGLEDVAQALHDAPDILSKIRVYWIGGPNKIWSANSYAYIAENFPNLWFIENNASYRGFFSNTNSSGEFNSKNYFGNYIKSVGALGDDFDDNHYKGNVKMGDTPSLLYMMDGNPDDPARENWGGSFEKINNSTKTVIRGGTTVRDTASVYAILRFEFEGPKLDIPLDSICFTLTVNAGTRQQKWNGYYVGGGLYVVNYAHKQTERINYIATSDLPGFKTQSGSLFIKNVWPSEPKAGDFKLGLNWFTDKKAPELFDGIWQGAVTTRKWREAVLRDWAKRWAWLK